MMQARTAHGHVRPARRAQLTQGNMGIVMSDDVARAVVRAVTQPRHVLLDTIEPVKSDSPTPCASRSTRSSGNVSLLGEGLLPEANLGDLHRIGIFQA
jgi:hypothetical protein